MLPATEVISEYVGVEWNISSPLRLTPQPRKQCRLESWNRHVNDGEISRGIIKSEKLMQITLLRTISKCFGFGGCNKVMSVIVLWLDFFFKVKKIENFSKFNSVSKFREIESSQICS